MTHSTILDYDPWEDGERYDASGYWQGRNPNPELDLSEHEAQAMLDELAVSTQRVLDAEAARHAVQHGQPSPRVSLFDRMFGKRT